MPLTDSLAASVSQRWNSTACMMVCGGTFFSKNIVCGGKWYSREERYADLADVIVRILGKIWYWSNGL